MTTVTFVQRFFLFRELVSGTPSGTNISFTVPDSVHSYSIGELIEVESGGIKISGKISQIFRKPKVVPSGVEHILYDNVEIDIETY